MLNYEVEAALLRPFVPRGTELDCWHGKTFLSLVGFRFLNTKVSGIPVPFHTNFDEVNLRFYVKRETAGEVRRGVVFIREIVPRPAIAFVARTFYNENYVALPMRHEICVAPGNGVAAAYLWRTEGQWCTMRFESRGTPEPLCPGSHEQFIAEHYWGYAAQRDGGCIEYHVEHPSWNVWQARHTEFTGKVETLYGREFAAVLHSQPASAFLADGSPVSVMRGRRLQP